jgi:serine/threonine-protein kinase
MGEVYRADDLKLGQPVALKFLPENVQRDEARLSRFLNEVRVALKVSHPNVCRVHDIGEVDGEHYLSMEYVDGEDLASLLRRIERLPQNKAVQIARQLCAGLAAAHEQGILHRDLKPANIMVDGRGRAKITDFGLANLAEVIEGDEARVGTPQYMSPEQHAGKEVTIRSDIYSLGLVLYELFTGKRAFEAATPTEIAKLQGESSPKRPSDHIKDLDTAVERVILRCLDRDPTQRPPSALAVSASLPGGDPLAAALAAGETPSPEMVAGAGATEGLRPSVAIALLVLILVGLPVSSLWSRGTRLDGIAPPTKPPEALRVEARSIIESLGYEDSPADSAFGFHADIHLLDHIEDIDDSPERWQHLATVRPAPIRFWYRQSPRPLVTAEPVRDGGAFFFGVSLDHPPPVLSGMVAVQLDTKGNLIEFQAIPPEVSESETRSSPPDWGPLFSSAGLDGANLEPVAPKWNPLVDCDVRTAWKTVYPEQPGVPIRVEAGAWEGRPVFFRVVAPWSRPSRAVERNVGARTGVGELIGVVLLLVILGGAAFLARRNLRLGRVDRTGALRVAGLLFLAMLLNWLALAHHVASMSEVGQLFLRAIPLGLLSGGSGWLMYVAVEPYVRRHWPQTLISWSRLLAGRFRDPLVGRDVLVGSATALVSGLGHRLVLYARSVLV